MGSRASPDLQAGKRISKLSVGSRIIIGVACPVALPRVQNEFRLRTVRCREPATSCLLGPACTVASSMPLLFSSDLEAANATTNAVSPICIEPLQIEQAGLSVAQAEPIRWL